MTIAISSVEFSPLLPMHERHNTCLSACQKIAKITGFALPVILGIAITYYQTLPGWNNPFIAASNITIMLTWGTLCGWGLKEFTDTVMKTISSCRTNQSLQSTALKVIFLLTATGAGFFAQMPFTEIAEQLHGKMAALATQFIGFTVPAHICHQFIVSINEGIRSSPSFAFSPENKAQKTLSAAIRAHFPRVISNTVRQTSAVRELHFSKWTEASSALKGQDARTEALAQDFIALPDSDSSAGSKRHPLNSGVRKICQLAGGSLTIAVLLLYYNLARDAWSPISEGASQSLGILAAITYLSTIVYSFEGTGHYYDLIQRLLIRQGPELSSNIHEALIPKTSISIYLANALLCIPPQVLTVKFSMEYLSSSQLYNCFFVVGNVVGSFMLTTEAMNGIANRFLDLLLENAVFGHDAREGRQLDEDLKSLSRKTQTMTIEELLALAEGLPIAIRQALRQKPCIQTLFFKSIQS